MFIELHHLQTNEPILISCLQIQSVVLLNNACMVTFVGETDPWNVRESYETVKTLIRQATSVVTG